MFNTTEESFKQLKPPTTFEEQLELLKLRNLIIEDDKFALESLSKINYYRLSAYLLPFKMQNGNYYNVSFNKIYNIYEFDRKFRSIIMSAIEPIEVLLRTRLAYYHSHKYGSEGYNDPNNFRDHAKHEVLMSEFRSVIDRNRNALFVKHHKENYGSHFPLWVAVEMFSFGMLSKFYSNMKTEDKKYIAKKIFNTGPEHLRSWLQCITDLRNCCAHYQRLYFHRFVTFPKLPNDKKIERNNNKVFDILYIMQFLYKDNEKWRNGFVRPIEALLLSYDEHIVKAYIGFPDDWLSLL